MKKLQMLTIAMVIFLGLLFAVLRLLWPQVIEYRSDIADIASELLQAPVSIDQIEAGWYGLHPVLLLSDVEVTRPSEQQSKLHVDSLEVSINLLGSLLNWEIRPAQAVLKVRELEVIRLPDGRFNFDLGSNETSGAEDAYYVFGKETFRWLQQQPDIRIVLGRLEFTDQQQRLPSLSVQDMSLIFRKSGGDVEISLTIPGSNISNEISAMTRLHNIAGSGGWPDTRIYVQFQALDLAVWRQVVKDYVRLPDSGKADLRLWLDIAEEKLAHLNGELSASALHYENYREQPAFDLSILRSDFEWQRRLDGWQLQLNKLEMQQSGGTSQPQQLSVDLKMENGVRNYLINTDRLMLANVLPLVGHQPVIPDRIRNPLAGMQPDAGLSNLRLQISYNEVHQSPGITHFAIQSEIENLNIQAYGEVPALKGIDAYLAATLQAGLLRLKTDTASVYMPTLFRDPIPLSQLKGDLNWSRIGDDWLIESSHLEAVNDHIKTDSRLSIYLPGQGSPFIDLQTNFKEGDGTHTSLYLPAKILDDDATEWLDEGIISGHVEYGSLVLHGLLSDFPFDNKQGRFEVSFKVRDGILNYYQNWPHIDQIEALVSFEGRGMHIEATAGKIFDADINHTVVTIDDLDADDPILRVKGKAKTSSKDLMHYLDSTRLAGDYQEALDVLTLEGEHPFNLDLQVALSTEVVTFSGHVGFKENVLKIPSWELSFNSLDGRLDFTDRKFTASNMKAVMAGEPVLVDVVTEYAEAGRETHIKGKSEIDIGKWLSASKSQLADYMTGKSRVDVNVVVPDYDASSYLTVSTNLQGTRIDLPAPFGKQTDTKVQVNLRSGFEGESAQQVEIEVEDLFTAALLPAEKGIGGLAIQLDQSGVSIDSSDLAEKAKQQIYIGGRLATLSVDEWLDWVESLPASKDRQQPSLPLTTDLTLGKLSYGDWWLEEVTIEAQQTKNLWEIALNSAHTSGRIALSENTSKIVADFDRLSLYKHVAAEGVEGVSANTGTDVTRELGGLTPQDFPTINASVDTLVYQDRELGQLELNIQSLGERLEVKKLSLKNSETQTDVNGYWQHEGNENTHTSKLSLTLNSTDFGNFLARHGFENSVKGGEASITADFHMPFGLPDYEPSHLSGQVELDIAKGEILEVNPGGAGRIFGLLSFQALPRRLLLDFRDLFSSGMSFDEIDGNFTFSQGQAYTNNLEMKAPSSRVQISGRVGLVEKDYDQLVKVTPQVSSTLPVTGALLGGPGLAAVMYLTHKVFKEPINELTETEYRVSGPWENPEITKLEAEAPEATESIQEVQESPQENL